MKIEKNYLNLVTIFSFPFVWFVWDEGKKRWSEAWHHPLVRDSLRHHVEFRLRLMGLVLLLNCNGSFPGVLKPLTMALSGELRGYKTESECRATRGAIVLLCFVSAWPPRRDSLFSWRRHHLLKWVASPKNYSRIKKRIYILLFYFYCTISGLAPTTKHCARELLWLRTPASVLSDNAP